MRARILVEELMNAEPVVFEDEMQVIDVETIAELVEVLA
jgi:hypothetical protein